MRKVIAIMNISLDGFCDHTAMIANDEIHQHYTDMLNHAGVLLYGRITYELMESYWPTVVANPTGNKVTDDFAVAIENVPKILFSHTVEKVAWKNVKLVKRDMAEEVQELKQQPGKDIFAGSPGLISSLTRLNLIDEYHLVIHPVVTGGGLRLFKEMTDHLVLKLLRTKTFESGHVAVYYGVN